MSVTLDENGVPVEANGKKIMKSQQNAFRKAMSTDYFKKFPVGTGLVVRGDTLTSLESTIYKWIMSWQIRYEQAINEGIFPITVVTQAPVTTFDCMRYLFRAINPSVYMDILD
jgi:hypothetical protein